MLTCKRAEAVDREAALALASEVNGDESKKKLQTELMESLIS